MKPIRQPRDPEERARTFAWIDQMKRVPNRYLKSAEKLVLEQIARHKPNTPNGGREIANQLLIADTGLSERSVQYIKVKARRKGLIDYTDNAGGFVGGRGNSTIYFLRDPASWFGGASKGANFAPFADPERVQDLSVKGAEMGTERVQAFAPTTTTTTQPLTARVLPAHVKAAPVARAQSKTAKPETADVNGRGTFGKWSTRNEPQEPDIINEQPTNEQMKGKFDGLLDEIRSRSKEPHPRRS
jgi:hypothetical protein